MGLHVVTPSGLHIDQLDGHYVVSKGKQVDVYKTYGAMVTGLTSGVSTKKPKRAKPAKKARKARRAAAPAAAKPRKKRRSSKPKTRRAAKRRSTLNAHGHKRGCKCMACSPATRKAAALGRKRAARKAGKSHTAKPRKAKKSKKRGGGGSRGGFPRSVRGYTYGGDPSEMQDRRRPGRPRKAPVYHGDVSRFDKPRRGNGRSHSSGMTFHMPARHPAGALGSGYATFRGSRRGAW